MADPERWVELPGDVPPPGESRVVEIEGRRLLVANAGGTPYAVLDQCPHVRVSLAGGVVRGTTYECPLHGGRFDLRNGAPLALPIRKPATCFAVRRAGDRWQVALPAPA
ncbi:MAG: Rieske 2Fe-2S domain-containing protein [Myxococcota bacterium]|nr:Rieske 2Fe-2S domain-containing protein [Myxococcales bacterium]